MTRERWRDEGRPEDPTQEAANSERLQKRLFEDVSDLYEAHYDDPTSAAYRRRFIHRPMLGGVKFEGKKVLEAMCGTGQTTEFLLSKGATVTGLDISETSVQAFRSRWPDCTGVCASLLGSGLESESFDCVIVEAGLHHLHPEVDRGVAEIHRLLVPGGIFCFAEPHSGSVFDIIRKAWYRRDSFFAENEESIDLEALKAKNSDRFEFLRESHLGNIAYVLVLQSMILRLPLALKKYYAPLLFPVEAIVSPFQGRRLSCMVAGQWRRKNS